MITRGLRPFLVALLLLILGCQEEIKITLKDPGERLPTFILETLSVLSRDTVEITRFSVAEQPSDGEAKWREVWRIETADARPKPVREIKLGIVPTGFREVRPIQELSPGKTYEVAAGLPGKVGTLSFVAQ